MSSLPKQTKNRETWGMYQSGLILGFHSEYDIRVLNLVQENCYDSKKCDVLEIQL